MGKGRIRRGLKAGGGLLALILFGVALPIVTNASGAGAAGPCGPPVVSVIACENTATGDPQSDWLVAGAGDATLQGFPTQMSVNAGQTITFKVNSTASAYHFDILRLGYYQANGARKVAAGLAPAASFPQTQPSCLTQSSTGLIDCGNWAVSASWAVPSTAVSGIYIAHLYRNDNGAGADVPFIVRNDARSADIVFQASDGTWEAYNTYGGNSLYQCTVLCPPGNPAGYKAAYAVSYNRPFHTAADDQGRDWVTYAELPMIEYLEANGYDVSYIASQDSDAGTSALTNHKIFMSTGHDEYWTANERTHVTQARDAGVNLAFFSGNEMFWKTRLGPSIDGSNTPQRTLTTYKETHFDSVVDPADPPTWSGSWLDPRFSPPADGGNPSNALTGQEFIVNSGTTDIAVPSTYSQLRFWRNTQVATLTGGRSLVLDPGAGVLGYEWDEDTDNGFRPPGLFDLSLTTASVPQAFNDYGTFTTSATATHHLTLYRAPSRALVFGAGTVQWSWGLVDNSPSAQVADRNMQQATVNLFADMGAQPFSLMTGLVAASPSTDTTPPTSQVTSPVAGATMTDGSTVTISGTASDSGGGVVAGVEVSTDGGTTWHPANGTTSWTYSWLVHGNQTVTIKSRAVDDSGNIETPGAGVGVNTPCPCTVFGSSTTPGIIDAGDPNSIEVGAKFTSDVFGTINGVRFYKSTGNTGTHVGNLWTASGQLLASASFSGETASGWQSVTFSQPVPIYPNTTYVASYFAPKGHYSADDNYFYGNPQVPTQQKPSIMNSGALHIVRQTPTVNNGVYTYAGSSSFPNARDIADNYWVDVSFTPQPAPGTPTNVVGTPGYSSVGLNWTAPSTGGPVTTYTVTPYIGTTAQAPTMVSGTPAPTGAAVTGLTNGTSYTFTVTASNPAGAGVASSPSNAVTPSATASVVINGGFENGMAPWTPGGGNPTPSVSTTRAHSGTSSALLGAVDPSPDANGNSSLTQTITVPTGKSQLSFWYWTQSSDTTCSGSACNAIDYTEAQLQSTQGATLVSIFKSNTNTQVWTQVVVDTTQYAGSTIVLYFNVHGDGSSTPDNTWMYLDDVALSTTGAPVLPGAPTGVAAVAGSGSATVSWTPPSSGGSPITGYTVTPFIGTTAQTPVQVAGSPPPTSTVVTGLTPGTAYTFQVAATNGVGTGPNSTSSNSVTIGPDTAPGSPTNVSATPASGQATVSWTAPFNGGSPITSYTIQPFSQGENGGPQATMTVTGSPPPPSATVTGLTNGTTYVFSVVATNAVGNSPASQLSNSVIPGSLPGAPTSVAATAGVASANVSWTAPSDGGSPITSYTITPFIGSSPQTPTTLTGSPPVTSTAISALSNGVTYTFTVAATNGIGTGPTSAPSNPVTPSGPTVPGAPTGVAAVAGNASASVSWGAPPNGGSQITSYTITPFVGGAAQPVTVVTGSPPVTSTVVNALVNGSTYTFTVQAANAVGPGPASAPSNAVTPSAPPTVPGAPTNVTATAGNASATIAWTAPGNGGSPITGYTITPFIGSTAQATTSAPAPAVTATVTGLANGTTYTFKVVATNAIGSGPASASSNLATPRASSPPCPCTIFGTATPGTVDAGDAASTVLGVAFTADSYGFVNGIRFYKASANTGTHMGSLWSGTGQLLASATFTGESASGWQQVTFSNPVSITPGAQYVASYLAPNGHYSASANAFASGVNAPPLYALANSVAANGLYTYSSSNVFPSQTYNSTNYFVDVIFASSTGAVPGAPSGVVAAAGNGSVSLSWTAPSSGGSPLTSYTITPYVSGTAQTPVMITGSPPVTATTVGGLTNGTTYAFKVAATNGVGTGPASPASNSATPEPTSPACPCTLLGTGVPANADSGDGAATVLGLAFTSDTNGFINGVRFYKASTNTGTHVGSLWSATGQLLASATFAAEGASGWQSVNFTTPVAVTAGTTYVASYLAPSGHYSYSPNVFASQVNAPPLYGLASSAFQNGNGLYTYASSNTFPTNSYNSTNYSVDVLFSTTAGSVPAAPTGVMATAGNASAAVSWTAPSNGGNPITGYTITPFIGGTAQAATTAPGSAVSATVTGLVNGTTYTFKVAATNSAGTGPASAASNPVTPQASGPACPCTIFGAATPATLDSGDTSAVNLGVAFTSDTNGFVNGIRFYKATTNTGTHVGSLWSASGQLLGSATFSGETASGWQTVSFSSPVAVTAGTIYVASYLAPKGHYPATGGAFASAGVDNPPLHALASGSFTNGNGLYAYSASTVYPTSSYNATNYFVDVVFAPGAGSPPGTPTGVSASAGNASATVSWTAPGNGGSPITSYTITPYIGTAAQPTSSAPGSAVSATVTGLVNGTTYSFTVAASNAIGTGSASANSNPVTPQASGPACPCTIFGTGTPGNVDSGDTSSVNLGVAFTSDVSGWVTGVRFYKASANAGIHVGTLWSATGSSLATATFTGETASGWQQVSFATPVAVTAGTTYVASYLAPAGHYSYTSSAFAPSGVDNPPLHALASSAFPNGNGLYGYASGSSFPNNSFNATNYWVDVVFSQTVPPGAPTGVGATAGNASATVSWTAPSNGGSSLISYTVTPYIGTSPQTATVVTGSPPPTSITVSNLNNGTTYTFKVSATNAVGTGPQSAASNAVTPCLILFC